jgi:hypothetical protein
MRGSSLARSTLALARARSFIVCVASAGQHQLPLHLDSSARAVYDFGSASDRAHAYQLVLLEAGSTDDLEQWLQHQELLRLWSGLYLPRVVRAAWQAQHRTLEQIGAGANAPQP